MSSPPNSIPLSLTSGPTRQRLPLLCSTSCTGSLEPIGLDLVGLAPPRMQETRCHREEGEDMHQELLWLPPRIRGRGSCWPPELPCAQAEGYARHRASEEEATLGAWCSCAVKLDLGLRGCMGELAGCGPEARACRRRRSGAPVRSRPCRWRRSGALARYLGSAGRSRRGEMSQTRKNEEISNRYIHNLW